MNRFYKVQPKQYVDSFTELPLQFLQGLAQTKQAGFDAGLASVDAAESLLNFNVIPGDTEHYKKKVGAYNDQISKVRDQLVQTGDYIQATRDLLGINRRLNKDQDLTVMKNQYEPWRKAVEERSKLDDYELRAGWQKGQDLMSATTFNPTLGSHNLISFDHGYKAPDYVKDAGVFGDLKLSTNEFGRTFWDDGNGKKIELTTQNDAITKKMIEQRAATSLPLYRDTPSYKDHLNEGRAYGLKGEQLQQFADAKGYENLVSKGMNQLQSVRKNIQREDLYSEDQRKARGLQSSGDTPSIPGQDASLTTQPYKPVTLKDFQTIPIKAVNNNPNASVAGVTSGYKNAETFDNIPKQYRDTFEDAYKTLHGEDAYNKVKEGKQKLTQEDLEMYTTYHNALNQGLRSNTITAVIKEDNLKDLHKTLFGLEKDKLTAGEISKGIGYGADTRVYDATENEWTTLGQIESKAGKKDLEYNINKRFTSHNPLYKLSGNDKRFAKGYSLISSTDGGQHQYFIPEQEQNIKPTDVLETQISSAMYTPGLPVKVEGLDSNGSNYHVAYTPKGFQLYDIDKKTGTSTLIEGAIADTPENLLLTLKPH